MGVHTTSLSPSSGFAGRDPNPNLWACLERTGLMNVFLLEFNRSHAFSADGGRVGEPIFQVRAAPVAAWVGS